jgi:hypothetical protein
MTTPSSPNSQYPPLHRLVRILNQAYPASILQSLTPRLNIPVRATKMYTNQEPSEMQSLFFRFLGRDDVSRSMGHEFSPGTLTEQPQFEIPNIRSASGSLGPLTGLVDAIQNILRANKKFSNLFSGESGSRQLGGLVILTPGLGSSFLKQNISSSMLNQDMAEEILCANVLKKRRMKMNKHKHRKRLRKNRYKTK